MFEMVFNFVPSPPAAIPPASRSAEAYDYIETALRSLDIPSAQMCELKSYKNPPSQAEHTLALVLYLLGRKNHDWRHAKHALQSHHRFLSELRDFTVSCANEGVSDPDRFISVEERLAAMQIDKAYVSKAKTAVLYLLRWMVYLIAFFQASNEALLKSSKVEPVPLVPAIPTLVVSEAEATPESEKVSSSKVEESTETIQPEPNISFRESLVQEFTPRGETEPTETLLAAPAPQEDMTGAPVEAAISIEAATQEAPDI